MQRRRTLFNHCIEYRNIIGALPMATCLSAPSHYKLHYSFAHYHSSERISRKTANSICRARPNPSFSLNPEA